MALARKLLIALWRLVDQGEVPMAIPTSWSRTTVLLTLSNAFELYDMLGAPKKLVRATWPPKRMDELDPTGLHVARAPAGVLHSGFRSSSGLSSSSMR